LEKPITRIFLLIYLMKKTSNLIIESYDILSNIIFINFQNIQNQTAFNFRNKENNLKNEILYKLCFVTQIQYKKYCIFAFNILKLNRLLRLLELT
jgi:hypothetical protein